MRARIRNLLIVLFTVFLISFPKGGFKISNIPITWGYILLIIAVPFAFSGLIKEGKMYFPKDRMIATMLCLPFILYSSLTLLFSTYDSLGFLFSFLLSILIMPIFFLIFFGKILDSDNFKYKFINSFVWSIRFVTIFGILLFLQNILTGRSIEIPYLTVNIDDVGSLDEKYNLRGNIMKFTSTYNNGNIFGVCMLILAPLYLENEKSKIFKIIFLSALALTLSRTVWLGMALIGCFYTAKNIKNTKGIIILIVSLCGVLIFVPLLLKLINVDTNFLFDRNLGGRIGQLAVLSNLTLFGNGNFSGISEIVYTSILESFGIIGLLFFLLYLFSPLIVLFLKRKKTVKNYHWGILIYCIICLSDGAMLLIPTMCFFWFISGFILSPNNFIKK